MLSPGLPARSPRLRPLIPKQSEPKEKPKKEKKVKKEKPMTERRAKRKRDAEAAAEAEAEAEVAAEAEAEAEVAAEVPSTFALMDKLTDGPTQTAARKQSQLEAEAEFMKTHQIEIHQTNAPAPCIVMETAPFPAPLVKLLLEQGFPHPSPVQAAAWPVAAALCDLLAVAKTGSGKTLGYLLPALTVCDQKKAAAGGYPVALVMAPTRELAMQIQTEATKFGKPLGCRAVAVYGGASKWGQQKQLQNGAEVIVATPGRLMDLLELHGSSWGQPSTSLEHCEVLVLDEADRMLDMGFESDIRTIVGVMNKEKLQTMLFTATWPRVVQRVAADLLKDSHVKVTVGTGGDKLTANTAVKQVVRVVEQHAKWDEFLKVMEVFAPGGAKEGTRVIIFANTKRDVNAISKHFWDQKYNVDSLSGDRTQKAREDVVAKFRQGSVTMVIATDVAARGLDIPGIEMVINYDFPDQNIDDYIHRIGRTGRAGAIGHAETLFTKKDTKYSRELVRILREAKQEVSSDLERMMSMRPPKQQKWW